MPSGRSRSRRTCIRCVGASEDVRSDMAVIEPSWPRTLFLEMSGTVLLEFLYFVFSPVFGPRRSRVPFSGRCMTRKTMPAFFFLAEKKKGGGVQHRGNRRREIQISNRVLVAQHARARGGPPKPAQLVSEPFFSPPPHFAPFIFICLVFFSIYLSPSVLWLPLFHLSFFESGHCVCVLWPLAPCTRIYRRSHVLQEIIR